MPDNDQCFASIALDALNELSRSYDIRPDTLTKSRTYTVGSTRPRFIIELGQDLTEWRSPDDRLILLGWGRLPIPFKMVPRAGVTYFDLRFGVHSRNLSKFECELKARLEAHGCRFREFGPPSKGASAYQSKPARRSRLKTIRRVLEGRADQS